MIGSVWLSGWTLPEGSNPKSKARIGGSVEAPNPLNSGILWFWISLVRNKSDSWPGMADPGDPDHLCTSSYRLIRKTRLDGQVAPHFFCVVYSVIVGLISSFSCSRVDVRITSWFLCFFWC